MGERSCRRRPGRAGYSGPVRSLRYVLCDVFGDRPLSGNPVAVFTDARGLDEPLMAALARELNLSETVFVLAPESSGHVRIRIMTPAGELPFAGHPALGAAFVLAGPLQLDEIRLETGRGIVPVRLEREGPHIVLGRMEQPLPSVEPMAGTEEILHALGLAGSELPVELYDNGVRHCFVCLASSEAVAKLRPDLPRLSRVTPVAVSCFAGSGRRWKTRMFWPAHGIPEDAATGSAAGPLAVHLARHGRIAFGEEIEICQGEEIGRPSTLYARAEGSPERLERVEVAGKAHIVARGEFQI